MKGASKTEVDKDGLADVEGPAEVEIDETGAVMTGQGAAEARAGSVGP